MSGETCRIPEYQCPCRSKKRRVPNMTKRRMATRRAHQRSRGPTRLAEHEPVQAHQTCRLVLATIDIIGVRFDMFKLAPASSNGTSHWSSLGSKICLCRLIGKRYVLPLLSWRSLIACQSFLGRESFLPDPARLPRHILGRYSAGDRTKKACSHVWVLYTD